MSLKIKWNAPVVLTFALVCTAVFLTDKFLMGQLMPFFTVYPSVQWSNPISIMSLFTHVAGHASLEHLLGNLTFILLLGPIIEEKYGSMALFQMILFTALVTGLINIFFFNTGLMGASGIVFMMIAILFIGKELLKSTEANQIAESAHVIGGLCGSFFGFRSHSK
jgi:membrane associated rhomboid family serine protease